MVIVIISSLECILFACTALWARSGSSYAYQYMYLAVYKIFKFKNLSNPYYVQYCMDILPINYALSLRKLSLRTLSGVGGVALFCTCIVVLFLVVPLDIVSPVILFFSNIH